MQNNTHAPHEVFHAPQAGQINTYVPQACHTGAPGHAGFNYEIIVFYLLLSGTTQFLGPNSGGNQTYKYNSSHS